MLKYQVRTLPRQKPRQSRPTILEEGSDDNSDTGSSSNASSANVSPSGRFDSGRSTATSSTSSLSRAGAGRAFRVRSASVSSLSSGGSSNDAPLEWGTMKIYTGSIRSDTDYKTVFVSTSTTAGELVRQVLGKFRLGNYKDPKLYFLSMHVRTKQAGAETDTVLGLEQTARPLELQSCHPKGLSRFQLQCRAGIRVRVHDHCLAPQSNYKSLLISSETTCAEGVALVLQLHRLNLSRQAFVLVSVNKDQGYEILLPPAAFLASVVAEAEEGTEIHLRPYTHSRLDSPPQSPDGIYRL